MLQQTQVATVTQYFLRWIARFPNIDSLAAADLQDVLRLWEGLGYYARARNLHKAAQQLVAAGEATLPQTVTALQALPGIGMYTAGAIASIAFGQSEALVDGNVKRVFARLFSLDVPMNTPAGNELVWQYARQLVPSEYAGEYNQALMDLGATICLPKTPLCEQCPLRHVCQAYQTGQVQVLPRLQPKARVPHYPVAAGVIWQGEQVLLAQRPVNKLLGGLWEFPGGKQEPGESLPECLQRELREELGISVLVGAHFATVRHAFTHFKITVSAFMATLQPDSPAPQTLQCDAWAWVALPDLTDYPLGKVDRQLADLLQNNKRLL